MKSSQPIFVKYPEIPHLAETLDILDSKYLQVFEKLDGGNSQIRMSEGRLFCGSRANFLRRERDFRFDWFRDFNKWVMSNSSFYNLPENLVLYGEFMAPHTLTYNSEFINRFFVIDVYDLNKNKFLPYTEVRKNLEDRLGVEDVLFLPILVQGTLDLERAKELATGSSDYSKYGKEGIVIKDYKQQKFAKFWRTSASPTEEGLFDEVHRVIKSMEVGNIQIQKQPLENLSREVFAELLRSGRFNISLAEISDCVKKMINKI